MPTATLSVRLFVRQNCSIQQERYVISLSSACTPFYYTFVLPATTTIIIIILITWQWSTAKRKRDSDEYSQLLTFYFFPFFPLPLRLSQSRVSSVITAAADTIAPCSSSFNSFLLAGFAEIVPSLLIFFVSLFFRCLLFFLCRFFTWMKQRQHQRQWRQRRQLQLDFRCRRHRQFNWVYEQKRWILCCTFVDRCCKYVYRLGLLLLNCTNCEYITDLIDLSAPLLFFWSPSFCYHHIWPSHSHPFPLSLSCFG